ncbi:MAG TPA: TIGR04222 domain-containing membrane protein [Actinokineospora sp.]|jgi:uncharacterized protein (TIGR04222 family)|nr:TIGR04222 domain-containing membrane protein [Actinokineospora sp.]
MTGLWISLGVLIVLVLSPLPPWSARGRVDLSDPEIAYLFGGKKRAVRVTLAIMADGGLVEAHPRGGVRLTRRTLTSRVPIVRAVYSALHTPSGPAAIGRHPTVRRALAELDRELVRLGLLAGRWRRFTSRRTVAGRRLVRRLRRDNPAAFGEYRTHGPTFDGELDGCGVGYSGTTDETS